MRKPQHVPVRAMLCVLTQAVALFSQSPGVLAQPLTLYERLAYGENVITGTCVEQGRLAVIAVDEVLKGNVPSTTIRIAYRLANWDRTPGEDKIEFEPGGRYLLVLEPERKDNGDLKGEDRFILQDGPGGLIPIPAEGSEVLLAAARKMISVQSITDQLLLWDAQRALLTEENYLLVEAGVDEVLKFRLGNAEMLPLLTGFLTSPRESFRLGSLQVITQILEAARKREERIPDEGLLVRDLLSAARGDSSPEVRAQAVRALRSSGREDLREAYREMAATDPSQLVRYEAQYTLHEMGGQGSR